MINTVWGSADHERDPHPRDFAALFASVNV